MGRPKNSKNVIPSKADLEIAKDIQIQNFQSLLMDILQDHHDDFSYELKSKVSFFIKSFESYREMKQLREEKEKQKRDFTKFFSKGK